MRLASAARAVSTFARVRDNSVDYTANRIAGIDRRSGHKLFLSGRDLLRPIPSSQSAAKVDPVNRRRVGSKLRWAHCRPIAILMVAISGTHRAGVYCRESAVNAAAATGWKVVVRHVNEV